MVIDTLSYPGHKVRVASCRVLLASSLTSRRFISSTEGVAPTRRAVKTPVVSRETTGVLRIRDVSRETIDDHDLSLGSDYEADLHIVQHGEILM